MYVNWKLRVTSALVYHNAKDLSLNELKRCLNGPDLAQAISLIRSGKLTKQDYERVKNN